METRHATLWPELTPEPPVVSGPLAVFPLLDDDMLAPSDYLLLSDAIETGLVRMTEVSEAGVVPSLHLEWKERLLHGVVFSRSATLGWGGRGRAGRLHEPARMA